ncbi:MAG: glycine cleavage system protein R [Alphaproteobacteria bacterium]
MSEKAVVSIVCVSHPGVLTALTRRLSDLGCNLADTTFAALAGTAEFTAICELPVGVTRDVLVDEFQGLPEIAGGRVSVSAYEPQAGASRDITHRIEFAGTDRPGLVVGLAEAFTAGGAEVVRLNSHTMHDVEDARLVIRFAVAIAEDAAEACLAGVEEAANNLGLECRVESA